MLHVRFNVVFTSLLLLAALCAFAVPRDYANKARGHIDVMFLPVADPVRRVAAAVSSRLRRNEISPSVDLAKLPPEARREIERLRTENVSLAVQLAQLHQRYANLDLAGGVANYSVACRVFGGPQGLRGSLSLQATAENGLVVGQPVAHRDGMVGRLTAVGPGGAQVRLITDHNSRIIGAFGRFIPGGRFGIIPTARPLIEGDDRGMMVITNFTMEQVKAASLRAGDWVVLADEDWPPLVNGYCLGSVDKIEPMPKSPLHALITVRPRVSLGQLREVMVVTGRPATPAAITPAAAPAADKRTEPLPARKTKGK